MTSSSSKERKFGGPNRNHGGDDRADIDNDNS